MLPVNIPRRDEKKWVYASLTVCDGPRRLKPTHAAFDRLCFTEPPRLTSSQVEIILANGDAVQRHLAIVLPHEATATRIPIRLVESRAE
jgi:hypothetical protein